MALRLYDEKRLAKSSKLELSRLLNLVETSIELTQEEVKQNRERIVFALNGGVRNTRKDILDDIQSGQADIDDIIGKNLHIK